MTDNSLTTRHDNGLIIGAEGNPDGKSANPFMLDWYKTEPRGVVAKPQRQVLAEFFTSMLILSADFKYEPVPGVHNHLYFIDGKWQLSLISPTEWNEQREQAYIGRCVLQRDMTWTLEPAEHLTTREDLQDAIGRFYDAFAETLDTDLTLEDILPFYVRHMPYWQRLHASALSRSIRAAVILGDQSSRKARDWLLKLPSMERALLPGA